MVSNRAAIAMFLSFVAFPVAAASLSIPMHAVSTSGVGDRIGTITAEDSVQGLVLVPSLAGLTPGPHGFHVHVNPNCRAATKGGTVTAGLSAGGHFDPDHSASHQGPTGKGHRGDLPALVVNGEGEAAQSVIAPRLKLADLRGRSLMIHAGGDNYADQPQALGGGGARVACGVVPSD